MWTFLKKVCIIFQNFPKNVIKDLYKWERGERGGGQKQLSLQHLAVTLKINICRPNVSSKYDKLNKYSS